jgi:hypothetical protein
MSIQIQYRRGTAVQHSSFTGANGEITVDTTNKTLRVHDGATVGGTRLAKFSDIAASSANLQFVTTNIVPSSNLTYDLGTSTKRWKDLYLSGNTIHLGTFKVQANSTNLAFKNQNNQLIGSFNSSSTSNFSNVSITNVVLNSVLGTQYGGTGKTSLTQNGVMYASNSSNFAFATGSNGKIMQIGSDGIPKFDDVDGGSFT